jgi:hypothetical protein
LKFDKESDEMDSNGEFCVMAGTGGGGVLGAYGTDRWEVAICTVGGDGV